MKKVQMYASEINKNVNINEDFTIRSLQLLYIFTI